MEDKVGSFLAHHGVKGMKWGRRKNRNANYSDQQVKRDRQIYGDGGTRRINKNLNRGDSISIARGAEKLRRDKVLNRNKYARQAGKATGAVAGGALGLVGVNVAKNLLGRNRVVSDFVVKALGNSGAVGLYSVLSNPLVQATVTAGAAKVGHMLAGDLGVNLNMRAAGYDPNRRY